MTRPVPTAEEAARAPRDPLPDPSLAPLVPLDPARALPPRLAAMKAMGSGVGTLGLEVGLSVVVGLLGGQYLDERLGSGPWLTVLGFSFGVAAAVRSVLRQMRRMRLEAAREEALQGNPAPLWETQGEREQRSAEAAREDRAAAGTRGEEPIPEPPVAPEPGPAGGPAPPREEP